MAAAEWWFYQVEGPSLAAAVGPLLEKCVERSWRVVVAAAPDRLAELDAALWTWRDDSFLPHAREGSGLDPADQPVWLATAAEPANGARVAMLLDGAAADGSRFERCIAVFHAGDADAREAARGQYREARSAGAPTRYFAQAPDGGWLEKK
jgi:DNA polymerase-3 subunit chi